MVSLIDWARARGRGFSGTVSLGNQVDLELADFLDFFAEDANTRAVCAYVEGVRRTGRLLESLRRCREAGKPVVLLKVGRTPGGIDSVAAHTASFAGSFQAFRAAAESAGARFADDPVGMIELAQGLAAVGTRVRRIGVISTSGGANGIIGDAAAEAGVRLAELGPQTLGGLTAHLAPLQVRNPVDLGARLGTMTAPEDAEGIARLLAADPAVDLLLVVLTSSPGLSDVTAGIVRGVAGSGTPLAGLTILGRVGDASRKVLADAGAVCFERLHDALAVLRALGAEPVPVDAAVPRQMNLPPLGDAEVLTEDAAKALLAAAGVATNSGTLVSDEAAAVAAAEHLGFPVVMKICSPSVVHKSDAGGVLLDLDSAADVRAAWADLTTRFASVAADGILVQRQVSGSVELLLGARRDEQFGPVVVVGAGGVYVHVLDDVQLALAPVSPEGAEGMLSRLRIWPLLRGVRGQPGADVGALADTVSRFSQLASSLGERLVELEINPLLVEAPSGKPVAVDARGRLAPASPSHHHPAVSREGQPS
jgi:acetyl-CoA synthetase (ADP-forming)